MEFTLHRSYADSGTTVPETKVSATRVSEPRPSLFFPSPMTRNQSPRSTPSPAATPDLRLRTLGGLELDRNLLRRHLALVGGPLDVMHTTAQFMRQANEQQIPVILLGSEQDSAFLDLPELLDLNAVRTVALSPVRSSTSPDGLREILNAASAGLRSLPGTGGLQLLFTGRHLGGHWPFVMGRLPALASQGTLVISDVRHHLRTPLPQFYGQFLVWPDGTERMERAVQRWQRHQESRPYRISAEPTGASALWSAS